jgi:hypothetical protein
MLHDASACRSPARCCFIFKKTHTTPHHTHTHTNTPQNTIHTHTPHLTHTHTSRTHTPHARTHTPHRYDMGIIKLVSRYEKCLNFESDYVKMLVKVCATTWIFVFFPIINTYFLIAKRFLLSGYPTYISMEAWSHNTKLKIMKNFINACSMKSLKVTFLCGITFFLVHNYRYFWFLGHWSNLGRGSKRFGKHCINNKMKSLYTLKYFQYKTRLTAGFIGFFITVYNRKVCRNVLKCYVYFIWHTVQLIFDIIHGCDQLN